MHLGAPALSLQQRTAAAAMGFEGGCTWCGWGEPKAPCSHEGNTPRMALSMHQCRCSSPEGCPSPAGGRSPCTHAGVPPQNCSP